jgi:hypothetical protein
MTTTADDPIDLIEAGVGAGLRPGSGDPYVMFTINGEAARFNLTSHTARQLGMLLIGEAAVADRMARGQLPEENEV